MFAEFSLGNWRQFEDIDLTFHPRLTVLTGANGSGKTTILNILNRHFGWNLQFVGTPQARKRGILKYVSDVFLGRSRHPLRTKGNQQTIGRIGYADGHSATLLVPAGEVSHEYAVEIENQVAVPGIFISSHRPIHRYQKLEHIPTEVHATQQLLQKYLDDLKARYNIGYRHQHTASYRLKEALISLATFGYGNEVVIGSADAVEIFEGFQEILKVTLPPTLGFNRVSIRIPEVVLETDTGDFSLDAVSGGVAALVDVSWQVYMRSQIDDRFVVIIDEPENHLHPELQRRLLPSFLEAFPNTQFIIATHNHFMVSAVSDSSVYVLNYAENRKVNSRLLDMVNKAGSSNEILREVLSLPFTIPIWADKKIQQIIERHSEMELNEEVLRSLSAEMAYLGLDHLYPETVSRVFEKKA